MQYSFDLVYIYAFLNEYSLYGIIFINFLWKNIDFGKSLLYIRLRVLKSRDLNPRK